MLWWTILIGDPVSVVNNILFSPYSIKFFFYIIFQAIGAYVNLYFLIPRFLEKGLYFQYVTLVILTIILTAAFTVPGYYLSAWLSGNDLKTLYDVDPSNYWYFFQVNTLPSAAASTTLAMSVKLTKNWIQEKRKQQLLEKEKVETELKFLKSQLNPHFLFNTINSIFVLIHKNPDIASESLAKFSELMRHQLYECNEQQIPIDKEITYLENFIELEKLRQEAYLNLDMHIERTNSDSLSVAPFVLMPFIENAFKHVSKQKEESNWIKMHLRFHHGELLFDISNSVSSCHSGRSELVGQKGIGLKNVRRRLDLIYPGRYDLAIEEANDAFKVRLRICLDQSQPDQQPAIPVRRGLLFTNA